MCMCMCTHRRGYKGIHRSMDRHMREIYTPRLGLKQPGTVRRDRTLGKSTSQVHRIVKNRAKPDEEVVQEQQEEEQLGQLQSEVNKNRRRRRKGDSTDGIASALTRRFGLAGGLAWFGVLAAGVIGEQVKTRLEKRNEEQSTRNVQKAEAVSTASGLSIIDTKIGGGSFPRTGDLVVLQYKAYANGILFEDTTKGSRAGIAFVYGVRPLPQGLCPGFEEALSTMKAGGSRTVDVPPSIGFGDSMLTLNKTKLTGGPFDVPANSKLRYEIDLIRVSIPPS